MGIKKTTKRDTDIEELIWLMLIVNMGYFDNLTLIRTCTSKIVLTGLTVTSIVATFCRRGVLQRLTTVCRKSYHFLVFIISEWAFASPWQIYITIFSGAYMRCSYICINGESREKEVDEVFPPPQWSMLIFPVPSADPSSSCLEPKNFV